MTSNYPPMGFSAEDEPDLFLMSTQMLARKLLWDIVPCHQAASMLPLMNLMPDSPDVEEMEHRASHDRLDRLLPIEPIIQMLVPLASGVTSSAMLVNSGKDVDAETVSVIREYHHRVIQAGTTAILANLMDMGIIQYTDGVALG
jgi:hypothetical protein